MIRTRYCLLIIIWMTTFFVSATPPSAFHAALKKLYPLATEVSWTQQGNYYVADFTLNGFEKKVWMNVSAQWVMTTTDLQTADQLTPGAYNAFMFGSYSQWTVENVVLAEFPKAPAIYVVQVNEDNSSSTYQLFYTADGRILQTRNVSYTSTALTPSVFSFQ
ncbi:PepSY-like domain-containing protein [Phocaeicola sp.]